MANEIYRLANTCLIGGIQCVNVFHFNDPTGLGSAQDLATDWGTNIIAPVAGWRSRVSLDVAFQGCQVTRLVPNDQQGGAYSTAWLGTGGYRAANPVIAGVITWRTGRTGRRHRGRSYVCGLNQAWPSSGTTGIWPSTQLADLTAIANALAVRYLPGQGLFNGRYVLGVYSRVEGIVGGVPTVAGFNPVTGFTAQAYVCTMGSRRQGRGL